MKWLNNLTTKGRQLDCPLMQVNKKAERPSKFYSEGVTRVGAIKTLRRKECLSPSGGVVPLKKEGEVKATRPMDVNNIRDVRRGAKIPFILKGGPDHLGPCRKGILFIPGRCFPADHGPPEGGTHGWSVPADHVPDLKAKWDRLPRCHSSERSEGYYSEDNNTTGIYYMAFESLDKTELEPIISSNSNGGNRTKIQLKVDLKNCLRINQTCQIRLK